MIHRKNDLHAFALGSGKEALCSIDEISLKKALSNLMSLSLEESIGHSAADDDDIASLGKAFKDCDLRRDL